MKRIRNTTTISASIGLMILFLMPFSIRLNANNQCVNAIPFSPSNNGAIFTQTDSIGWFSFAAQSNSVAIKIKNLPDPLFQGIIYKVQIYSGTCSNPVFVAETIVPNYSDSVLYLGLNNFISGNSYFFKTYETGPTCSKCTPGAKFSIDIITNPSSGCNWSLPSVIYVPPLGSVNNYQGFAGVFAQAPYSMRATQTGGNLQLSNFLISWDNCNGNSVVATNNYSGVAGATTCISGWEGFFIDGNVVGNPAPGEYLCMHLEILDYLGQMVCDRNVCIEVCGGANAGVDQTICAGSCATLSATGATSFDWFDQNNNLVGSGQSIIVCPTATTSYTAVPTVGVCNPASDVVTVNVTTPQISFSSQNELCAGQTFTFTNTTPFSSSNTTWNFGDGSATVTSFNATHVYTNPGQYTVTMTSTSLNCPGTATALISVSPAGVNCCSSQLTYTYNGSLHLYNQTDVTNFLNSFAINSIGFNAVGVKDTLFIEPQVILSVQNSNIDFGPWGKIIIKQGAKMIVDNCNLQPIGLDQEPPCVYMWQGVEVWGDNAHNQTQINPNTQALYQGYFEMKNGSSIINAHTGIIAGKWLRPNFDPNGGGGIVFVSTGSGFVDCGYAMRFMPYSRVNISKITNASFISGTLDDAGYITGNSYTYPNQYNPIYAYANQTGRTYCYVQSIGVKWVQMTGSTLTNSEYGVVGINSSLRIGGSQIGQGNSFSTMNQAEVHSNIFVSPYYSNRVTNNVYSNSLISIQSWNGIGDQISKNNIPTGAFVGIGAVGSGGLFITDNLIGSNNGSCLVGVSASNTGTMGGLIGRINSGNTFTQCLNGTWLQTNNANLQVRCNNYDNFSANNYVSNWRNFGTLANQGQLPILTDKDPAGNLFIQYSPLRNQIQSSSTLFDYYAHSGDLLNNPVTVIPQPTGILTAGNIQNTGYQMTSTSCDPGPPCTNCNPQLVQTNTQINNLQTEKSGIEAQLDGAQTQVLMNAINSNMSSGQLKDLLLANSPLSDQVLLAYIAINGTPPGTFKDVIVPNSPVSKEIRPALYAKIESLPNGIKNQIIAAQSNYQNRTLSVVVEELQSATGKRQQLYNNQMTYYIDRTEIDSTATDSIKWALQVQNTQAALEALASSYLAEGNYAMAISTINSLNPESPEAQAEKDLLLLLYGLYSSGRDIFQMNAGEEQAVRNTAAWPVECLARSNARVILFAAFGEPLDLDLQMNNLRTGNPEPEVTVAEPVPSFLGEAYPNPADENVNMECNIPEGFTGNLSIFDVNGKLIFTRQLSSGQQVVTLETKNWVDGIYLCSLELNGERIGMQKIVIANQK